MNRTERRVAGEKLHIIGVIGHVIAHELYRVSGVHGEGLTEKEHALMVKRHKDLRAVLEDISRVCNRCKP